MISMAINYAGHTVYDDGRVYKSGELLGTYATLVAAKGAATRNQRRLVASRHTEHQQRINRIVEGAAHA